MDIEIIILILGVIYYIWYSIKKAAEEVKKNRPGQGGMPQEGEEPGPEREDRRLRPPVLRERRITDKTAPQGRGTSADTLARRPEAERTLPEPAAKPVYRGREFSRDLRKEIRTAKEEIKSLRPVKPEHPRSTARYPQHPLAEPAVREDKTAESHPYADFDLRDAVIKSVILERVTG